MGNSGIRLGGPYMFITMQEDNKGMIIFYSCGPACIFDIWVTNSNDPKYSTDLPVRVLEKQQQ